MNLTLQVLLKRWITFLNAIQFQPPKQVVMSLVLVKH